MLRANQPHNKERRKKDADARVAAYSKTPEERLAEQIKNGFDGKELKKLRKMVEKKVKSEE